MFAEILNNGFVFANATACYDPPRAAVHRYVVTAKVKERHTQHAILETVQQGFGSAPGVIVNALICALKHIATVSPAKKSSTYGRHRLCSVTAALC
jgi:hypothetical protein